MTEQEDEAVMVATAQSHAALRLMEKLLLFIGGQSPKVMEDFLAVALTAEPIPGSDPYPTKGTLIQETADRLEWELLSGIAFQLRKARPPRGH